MKYVVISTNPYVEGGTMKSHSVAYPSGDNLPRIAKSMLVGTIVLGAVAASVWAIVFGVMNWNRGIYGGMHLNDAEGVAYQAMVVNHGKKFADQIRYADPPAVKKHFNFLSTGTGQVREMHLIGPKGGHFCVDVWNPHENWTPPDKHGIRINIGASYRITRGCKF